MQAALKALEDTPAAARPANGATKASDAAGVAPHWRKVWHWLVGQPRQNVPLTGALASVLIASLVVVMWYGQELPDAQPERVQSQPSATAPARAAPEASAQLEAPPAFAPPPDAPKVLSERVVTATQVPAAQVPTKAATALAPPGRSNANTIDPAMDHSDAQRVFEPAAPPPEAAKPAAKMAVPAPAARAPAPVFAAAPPPSWAEAAPATRRKAAAASNSNPSQTLVLEGQRRILTAAQSAQLLAALRALPWQEETARTDTALGQSGLGADRAAALTLQTPDGERWEVYPSRARTRTASTVRTAPLTAAQWQHLRTLAEQGTP